MKNLKNQLQDLERQHKQKRITSLSDDLWKVHLNPFVGFSFDPQPLPQSYTNITSPSLNIWASEQRKLKPSTRKEPTFTQESQSIADVYYTIDVVIKRFLTRLQGRLRDWYHRIGEYRQLQIQKSISPEAFMSIIYLEFIEFLGNEAYRALEERNVTIAQTTLGELYQLILNALAKLCNQKKFLAEFERTGKRLETACDDKYLQIKCKDKSSCDCTDIKKKFHSKRFSSLSSKPRFSRQSCKKWKFIRKKKQRGITSDRCFICQKRGHFVRSCPDKKRSQELIQALNQVEPVDVSDLESFYSLDDEPNARVLSKFDLKSGFWQLGIKPEDRPKQRFVYQIIITNGKMNSLMQKYFQVLFSVAKLGLSPNLWPEDFTKVTRSNIFTKDDSLVSGLDQLYADFLLKLSHLYCLLFPMLKKNPPEWTSRQTKAVKGIKCLAEKMPPLKILASSEKRILQTDRKVGHNLKLSELLLSIPRSKESCSQGRHCNNVNPSSRRCERKLQTLYVDIRSLMTRENGVDPDKFPYYVMRNILIWSKDHPDAYKWIEANRQWLYDNFDHFAQLPPPIGLLQDMTENAGGEKSVISTQEHIRNVIKDMGEDDDFTRAPWLNTIDYVNVDGGIVTGYFGDVKKCLKNGKLEKVVAVIKSCTMNALGGLIVTLKELSSTISDTIHYKVLTEERFA
ncbi:putative zinc finger, CCHC-type containing protein [Tanacetum coccineum]